MPKANPLLSVFNAGEFSPLMEARTDFEKYSTAISRGLNLVCLPQGGLTFRPGNRFVNETKLSSGLSGLIPFEPASSRSYMIEAGQQYFRFYRNQAPMTAVAVGTAITNGTFASGISGWTDRSTGSGSISWNTSQSMNLVGPANGYAWAEQALTIATADQNSVHVVRFTVTGRPGSKITVQVGASSKAATRYQSVGLGVGWHMIAFTPGAATVYLQFINTQNDTMQVSAVSVLSGAALEIPTPYAAADVEAIRYTQSADVLYLFHDNYAPRKLERHGDSSWSLTTVFFADGPYLGINPQTDLGAANLIKNGRFDGGYASWVATVTGTGFVNYLADSQTVLLTQYSSTAGTARITQPVATGAPALAHVVHFQIVGGGTITVSIGTSSGASDIVACGALPAGWYSFTFTPGVSTFYIDFAQTSTAASGAVAGGVGGVFCYNTTANLLQANSTSTGLITLTALGDFAPFASTDVGRVIRLSHAGREPGWGVITAYSGSQTVTVFAYRAMSSLTPTETWQLGAWSDTTGWPHCGTFYQQRLFCARTTLQPQTIWGSQSGDFQNMRPDAWVTGATTVVDTCALNFTIASNRVSPINWLVASKQLLAGTGTGVEAFESKGAVLTPSDFASLPQSSVGTADIAPVQIDAAGLFVQKAMRSVYDLTYQFQIDGFTASDITILADHITAPFAAQIVYQSERFSNVWTRMQDGTLACLTYKRGQNVAGWTPVQIAGSKAGPAIVESIAVIPGSNDTTVQQYSSLNRDEVWMIVNRTINGQTKRYIEIAEGYFDGPNRAQYLAKSDWQAAMLSAQVDAFYVDSGLTYKGAPVTSISGLDHLEGETVKVVADGAVQSDKTVTSGAITLDQAASTVHVGLYYNWVYRGLKLPFGSPTGPGVAQNKGISGLSFVLRDSASFKFGIETDQDAALDEVPFRTAAMSMGVAVPLFSGEVANPPLPTDGSFDSDPRIVLQGYEPLPWTLLGIVPQIKENEL